MYKLFIMEFDDFECASKNESDCQHLVVRQICEVGMTRRDVVFRRFLRGIGLLPVLCVPPLPAHTHTPARGTVYCRFVMC
jgi:hypothetical protein